MSRFGYFTNPENHSRLVFLRIVLGLALLAGAAAIGYRAYRPWRLDRLMVEARAAAGRGDLAAAALSARRALQTSPDDVAVCRLMAEVCEQAQNPDAVSWRGRVAELSPGSTPALLDWARIAVQFHKHSAAEKALAQVPAADRRRVEYFAAAGKLALETGRPDEAARLLADAVRLEPKVAAHRLALGTAQVRSADFFTREAGRKVLATLAAEPEHAAPALRAAIASYEAHGEPQAALRESHHLVETPGHTFLDALTRLRLLHSTHDARFANELLALQEKSAANPRDAGALIVWMGSVELAAQAVEWATQRAPKIGKMGDVRQALAGCHIALKDWPSVLKLTHDGPWRQGEYIRHAYRAKALRETGDAGMARTEWNMAMSAAQTHPEAIVWLARVADHADWDDEAEKALWNAIENVPDPLWAISDLGRRFHEKHDTEALRRLAGRFMTSDAQNDNARNDFAFLSVLLGKETERALILATELHKKQPANAAYASTYAVALHRAKRSAEARQIFETLPLTELEKPAIAAHYGIVLAATGAVEKARRFLDLGRLAPLLPEEAELLEKAARSLPEQTAAAR